MVQGGDPTGTGRGGTSIYGQRLYVISSSIFTSNIEQLSEDEIHPELRFVGAGKYGDAIEDFEALLLKVYSLWPTLDQIPTVR